MGNVNRADCWYLYAVSPSDCKLNRSIALRTNRAKGHIDSDQTLEVLMTDLDVDKMRPFYQTNCSSASEATKVSFHYAQYIVEQV